MVCAVEDISHSGALLRFARGSRPPDRFLLLLNGNNAVQRVCDVARRSEGLVAVRFVPDMDARAIRRMLFDTGCAETAETEETAGSDASNGPLDGQAEEPDAAADPAAA